MESNSDNPKLPEMYRVLLNRLLTADRVAEWWQIDIKTVYAYAQRGDIPFIRVNHGRSIRFVEWQMVECLIA